MASAPLLQAALDGVGALSGPLVLDFSGVTFMDSSGLQVLIATSLKRGGVPGSVIVRNPSAQVIRVLQITDLGSLLEPPDNGAMRSP